MELSYKQATSALLSILDFDKLAATTESGTSKSHFEVSTNEPLPAPINELTAHIERFYEGNPEKINELHALSVDDPATNLHELHISSSSENLKLPQPSTEINSPEKRPASSVSNSDGSLLNETLFYLNDLDTILVDSRNASPAVIKDRSVPHETPGAASGLLENTLASQQSEQEIITSTQLTSSSSDQTAGSYITIVIDAPPQAGELFFSETFFCDLI